jgi:hypothetical protein
MFGQAARDEERAAFPAPFALRPADKESARLVPRIFEVRPRPVKQRGMPVPVQCAVVKWAIGARKELAGLNT